MNQSDSLDVAFLTPDCIGFGAVFKVPIAGWSSNTLMSDTASTRKVATGMVKTSGTYPASVNIPNWTSKLEDTHDEINLTTGTVTVKVPGTRLFVANIGVSPSDNSLFGPVVNNVFAPAWPVDTINTLYKTSVAVLHDLKVGDVIAVRNGGSGTGTISNARFSTLMIQGPAQIQAATKVVARYTASGKTIPNAALTIVDFDTKTTDTTSIVTTGAAWKATAQAPCDYQVSAKIGFALFNVTGTVIYLAIFKNGVEYGRSIPTVTSAVSQVWGAAMSFSWPHSGQSLEAHLYSHRSALPMRDIK